MKKIILFSIIVLGFVGCQNKEEKATELIKREMAKTEFQVNGYEPISIEMDSCFNTIYMDSVARLSAFEIEKLYIELKANKTSKQQVLKDLSKWEKDLSKHGREMFSTYKEKVNYYTANCHEVEENIRSLKSDIKEKNKQISSSFIGWKVTHQFKCMNEFGGSYSRKYLFVTDKDFKMILYHEDLEDKANARINKRIDEAIL